MTLVETYHGYIETTRDSLLIFEACKRGLLPRICRRLQDKERQLVQSGTVFCFDENESGIKRWTDGLLWSPSRILGNFLIYRELETKTPLVDEESSDDAKSYPPCTSVSYPYRKQRDRTASGSLKPCYRFKTNGLIKKSMSLMMGGVQQHLISYYNKDDVLADKLPTPSLSPELATMEISTELLHYRHFRVPLFLDEGPSRDKSTPGSRYLDSSPLSTQSSSLRTKRRVIKTTAMRRSNSVSSGSSSIQSSDSPIATETPTGVVPHLPKSSISPTWMLSDGFSATSSVPQHSLSTIPVLPSQGVAMTPLKSNPFTTMTRPYQRSNTASREPFLPTEGHFSHYSYTPAPKVADPPLSSSNTLLANYSPLYNMSLQNPTERAGTRSMSSHGGGGTSSISRISHPSLPLDGYCHPYHEQNPHQHLFSSSSFHTINYAAMPTMIDITANSFMLDPTLLLGSGWNEFDLQM